MSQAYVEFPDIFPVDDSILNGTIYENFPITLWCVDITTKRPSKDPFFFYKPFSLGMHYVVHHQDRMTNIKCIVHDMTHMLDFFIKNKSERLLQPNFGYDWVPTNKWTLRMWENETNVLAMQHALLTDPSNSLIVPCVETDYKEAIHGYLFDNMDSTTKMALVANNEKETFPNRSFKYWKTNCEFLKTKYHEMCHWIRGRKEFNV